MNFLHFCKAYLKNDILVLANVIFNVFHSCGRHLLVIGFTHWQRW
nr:MAG TPA: hypothetical protein [Caudoviricetes sp.]